MSKGTLLTRRHDFYAPTRARAPPADAVIVHLDLGRAKADRKREAAWLKKILARRMAIAIVMNAHVGGCSSAGTYCMRTVLQVGCGHKSRHAIDTRASIRRTHTRPILEPATPAGRTALTNSHGSI